MMTGTVVVRPFSAKMDTDFLKGNVDQETWEVCQGPGKSFQIRNKFYRKRSKSDANQAVKFNFLKKLKYH